MNHAMTCYEENSEVHLFRVSFEQLYHFCDHLLCLLRSDAFFRIFNVLIQYKLVVSTKICDIEEI